MERIYCGRAMAALRKDGSVVTWGETAFGGDSSARQAPRSLFDDLYYYNI